MAYASYKGTEFAYGCKVLETRNEKNLKEFRYPNLSGAEHEDLGELPQVFMLQVQIPGDAGPPYDLQTLMSLYQERTPGSLYLPGRGVFQCYFRKFLNTGRQGSNGLIEIELEFVETLLPSLTLERQNDELEDMDETNRQLQEIETIVSGPPLLFGTELTVAQGIYDSVLAFAQQGQQTVGDLNRRITEIKDAVERPYNELQRLAADVEQVANQAQSLYRSIIKYADLPYTIARRLKNTQNLLTSVARRFLPPPIDRFGRVIGELYFGPTLTHRVVNNETLQLISLRYYGTGMAWECLAEANGIPDGNNLKAGQLIVIPDFAVGQKIEIKPGKARIAHATCNS